MRQTIIVAILLLSLPAARALAGLRVALVSTGLEKDKSPLIDLAQVKLSEDPRIELLERANVRTILQEQKLSLAGIVNGETAVAAGKLLRVDVFATVQNLDDETPPTLTVFDGFNGARLADVDLPKGDVQAQVDAIVFGIDRARQKLDAPLHAKTLCLLGVRNADLPRSMDGLCNATAGLLERRLLASDDIRLLERKRLENINRERALGTLDPKHDILASVVAIDLEFARSADRKGSTVTALLTDAAGKPLQDAQQHPLAKPAAAVDPANVAQTIDDLASRIADAIAVTPGQMKLDTKIEGARFQAEAYFLNAHRQYADGLAAAESAYALNPDNYGCAALLAGVLLHRAVDMIQHHDGDVAAMEMATRALKVRETRLMRVAQNDPKNRDAWITPDSNTGDRVIEIFQYALRPPASNDPATRAAARQFADAYISFTRRWLKSSEAFCAGNEHNLGEHMTYVRLNRIARCLALASTTIRDYVDEIAGMYQRYLAIASKLDAKSSLRLYLNAGRDMGQYDDYWTSKDRGWTPADFKGGDRDRVESVFQLFVDHPSKAVQFYGLWNRLRFRRAAGMSDAEFEAQYAVAKEAARVALDDQMLIDVDKNGSQRNFISWEAMSLMRAVKTSDHQLADRLEWYDFFIRRCQLPGLAIYHLYDLSLMKASGEQVVDVLQRLDKIVDDPACTFLQSSQAEARVQLSDRIRYLAGIYPKVRETFLAKSEAKLLLRTGGAIVAIEHVIADHDGSFAIVLADDHRQPVLEALRLALDGGGANKVIASIPLNTDVNDVCLTDRWIIVATDHGVVLFPRNGIGKVLHLTSANGLPTDVTHSVAILGNIIYAGLGDGGYLVSYDLDTQTCNVLASSRRKQMLSPFDDATRFTIARLIADPARNRVLVLHCRSGRFQENGLWELDAASGKFKQLLEVYFDYGTEPMPLTMQSSAGAARSNAAATRLLPSNQVLINSYNWAVSFDPRTGTLRILFADMIGPGPLVPRPLTTRPSSIMRATTRPTLDERRAARDAASTQPRRPQPLHPKTTPFDFIRRIAAPYSLNAGYLWSGAPLCRVEPDTRRVDPIDLPEDEPRAGGPGSKLQPTTRTAYRLGHLGRLCEWIEPLPDESHVIAGNVHRLWLIPALASAPTTQPATAPSTQPATQK